LSFAPLKEVWGAKMIILPVGLEGSKGEAILWGKHEKPAASSLQSVYFFPSDKYLGKRMVSPESE
jgi:hypothetical protein